MPTLIYFNDNATDLILQLGLDPEENLTIECRDENNNLLDTIRVEVFSQDTTLTFKNIGPAGYYNFVVKSEDEEEYYTFYFLGETFEEWIARLKIDEDILSRFKKQYFPDVYNGKKEVIETISEKLDENNLDEAKALDKLINDFNKIKTLQNDSTILIKPGNIIKLFSNEDIEGYHIGYNCDGTRYSTFETIWDENRPHYIRPYGKLYRIDIFNDDASTVQTYIYRKFNNEISKILYPKQNNQDLNIPSDIEELLQNTEEQKILALIDLYSPRNPFLALPKITIENNTMSMSFGEETNDRTRKKMRKLINNKHELYLYFAEYDSLLNNEDYRTFRERQLSWATNIVAERTEQSLMFNNERYFYWIGTEDNIILSNIGTIDITGEDDTDYNQLYAELKTKRNLNNYIDHDDYKNETSVAMDYVLIQEDLAYEDTLYLYQDYLLRSINNREKYRDLVKCLENVSLKASKKFDHQAIENITVKYNYNEAVFKIKNESGQYLADIKKYDLINDTATENIKKIQDNVLSVTAGKNSIVVVKFINTKDFTISRYVMLYNYGANNIMKVYTNGLEKENIYGL